MSFLVQNEKIILSIHLKESSKHAYKPGEAIEGKIQVYIPSSLVDINLSDINVEFVGQETSMINDPDTIAEEKRRQHYVFCSSKEILTSSSNNNNVFNVGINEFPFSCVLPMTDLPNSMSFGKREEPWSSKCSVNYFVRCHTTIVNTKECGINLLLCNNHLISAEKEFLVNGTREHVKDMKTLMPVTAIDEIHDISYCGIVPKGRTMYSVKVPNTPYAVGDTVNVAFQAQTNIFNTQTEFVCIQMREHVSWVAEGKAISKTTILTTKSFENIETGHDDWYTVSLTIPQMTRKAFNGKLITVNHDIKVALVSRSSCISSPETILPIKISKKTNRFLSNGNGHRNESIVTNCNPPKKIGSMEFLKTFESSNYKIDKESGISREPGFFGLFTACF